VIAAFTWDSADPRYGPDNEAGMQIATMARLVVDAWSPGGISAR
jgi:hypothetical protein